VKGKKCDVFFVGAVNNSSGILVDVDTKCTQWLNAFS
jgi:hypothetical protein